LKLTTEEVRYVADLANLRLTEEEVVHMSHDLGQILTYIEELSKVNTEQVAPMAQVLYEADETATLREDRPRAPLSNQKALENAAASGAGYYKVPKVIER
jgi:aspartyl-tRNA(Asn)/glutamyl-tRNA(Gln) amidotransferase subunit C